MPLTIAAAPNTILSASEWLIALATGTLATSIAVIAIALVGFAMLNGQIDWRRGATTVFGCFILFGAPAIALALQNLARSDVAARPTPSYAEVQTQAPQAPAEYDPYAGASIIR